MKVLFLCKSNVTRSQMAEAFFNKYSKQDKAQSAALIKAQEKMHELVVRAMAEKGINVRNNKSKMVTKIMIEEADIVVLMNPDLKSLYKFNKKIEIWHIPDVVADEDDEGAYPQFIKVRDIIEEKVRELILKIFNLR
jgi:arsenate reductase (thioredoxin)